MKRFILVLLFSLAIFCAHAQKAIQVELNNGIIAKGILISENESAVRVELSNGIRVFYKEDIKSISTLDATEVKALRLKSSSKVSKQPLYNNVPSKGYHNEISFGFTPLMETTCSLNYIGGYSFNNYLFVGFGTGINFNLLNFSPAIINGYDHSLYKMDDSSMTTDGMPYPYRDLPRQMVTIPIYAHLRVYINNKRWAPFIGASGGLTLSKSKELYVFNISEDKNFYGYEKYELDHVEKYGSANGLFELTAGVRWRCNEKYAFNLHAGYILQTCDYAYIDGVGKGITHGFVIRAGFIF